MSEKLTVWILKHTDDIVRQFKIEPVEVFEDPTTALLAGCYKGDTIEEKEITVPRGNPEGGRRLLSRVQTPFKEG